jgi:hypothetical protein
MEPIAAKSDSLHFAPARDARGRVRFTSKQRPNFCTAAKRRDVPNSDKVRRSKVAGYSITSLVTTRAMRRWRQEKKPSPKLVFSLSFFMGHNCLWRSHAYSLSLTFSVSHRGLFFGSGSLFVSSRNNRAASEIRSAGGLFEAQETYRGRSRSTRQSAQVGSVPFPQ